MEVTSIPPKVNMNVLSTPKTERQRGEHGWYTGGTHSYDSLLKHQVVRDWIDNYTAHETRRSKLYQFQKVLEASGFKDPAELLKMRDDQTKRLAKRDTQLYPQHATG